MRARDRRRDEGKRGSASPLTRDSGTSTGSTPLPLMLDMGRCIGADASGMATSTQTASVAASFSVRVLGLGDAGIAGGGDRVLDKAGDPMGE